MSLLRHSQAKSALIPPFRRYKLSQIPQHAGRLLVQGQQRPGEPQPYRDDKGGADHAGADTGLLSRASPAGSGCVSDKVATWLCGAPLNVLGENTSTKLMPSPCQSTLRRLLILAGMSRPSTLTTISSPIPSLRPSAIFFSSETSGGPL